MHYWFSPSRPLTKETLPLYRAMAKENWMRRMDSVAVMVTPPTFSSYNEEVARGVAELSHTFAGQVRVGSLSVGKRGWESSNFAQGAAKFKAAFDASKNLEPAEWFKKLMADTKTAHAGLSFEMLNWRGMAQAQDLGAELTRNTRESRQGVPKDGSFALWMTLAFEAFGGREAILQTVKNVRDEVDYFVWMDTRLLFEKHGMELCRQRVRELTALCGRDKTVIQVGALNREFSPYPKEFMAMCREEGVRTFFLFTSPSLMQSEAWRNFVTTLP